MEANIERVEQLLKDALVKAREAGIVLITEQGVMFNHQGKIHGLCVMSAFVNQAGHDVSRGYCAAASDGLAISTEVVWNIVSGWDGIVEYNNWHAVGARLRNEFNPVKARTCAEALRAAKFTKKSGDIE